jgi:hypothetical protein
MYTLYIRNIYRVFFMEVQYPIRVDKDLKDHFISVCKDNESTAAQELRKFMKDYIKKNNQQDLFNGKK